MYKISLMFFLKIFVNFFYVSTPIGESILAERVYCVCVISINQKDTMTDLFELDMVDFNVIMGMDWRRACYTLIDC